MIRRLARLCGLVALSSLAVAAAPAPPPPAAAYAVLTTPAAQVEAAGRAAIFSVAAAGERLVAVGERGIVLLSDDAGRSWRQARVPVSADLTAVEFVSPETGWAVGHFGVVLRSDDAGESWTLQLDGRRAAALALEAAEARAARDAPDAELALREARYLVSDGPDKPFLDLHFASPQRGYVVGAYNLAFRTDDGGRTWSAWQAKVDNPRGMHLYGIAAVGGGLMMAGEQGLLLRAAPGSAAFRALPAPYEGSYFGLVGGAGGEVVVYGLRGQAFRSRDGGRSWTPLELPTRAAISDGARLADGRLVLVGQDGDLFVGGAGDTRFDRQERAEPVAATSIVAAGDGAVVLGTLRGVMRAALAPEGGS